MLLAVMAATPCTPCAHAQEWVLTDPPVAKWNCISSSADAVALAAGFGDPFNPDGSLFCSTNGAADWFTNTPALAYWVSVATSADGLERFAADANGLVYRYSALGAGWEKLNLPALFWLSVACSTDGSIAALGGKDCCYVTTNRGASWSLSVTNTNNFTIFYTGVAASADGRTLLLGTQNNPDYTGTLYVSTNSGANWIPIREEIARTSAWTGVACSADGRIVIATAPYHGVFVSTNMGATWSQTNIPTARCVASSADGRTLVAGDRNGTIHVSRDSGLSWSASTPTNADTYWMGVCSSADGCKLAAAAFGGQIWVSQNTPHPVLEITPSAQEALISWIVPSMNFVLQESADPAGTNWADVATTPTLNYTNIHYEVRVPLAQERRFYRLISR